MEAILDKRTQGWMSSMEQAWSVHGTERKSVHLECSKRKGDRR